MEFVIGGAAACCAGVFTNPLEVVKTRFQLQGELQNRGVYTRHYKNAFQAFYVIAKEDGILALQKGLVPALWYQLFMNGVRLGSFDFLQKSGFINSGGEISFPRSIAAGAASGCIGALVGSPFYMVKTQIQAQSSSTIAVGFQHQHQGLLKAFQSVISKHGFLALWRGASAAMSRVTCGSAAQLATFSNSKSFIEKLQIFKPNSWLCALAASMLGGVAVVVCMTPLDVVSTRMYNQGVDSKGRGLIYSGLWDCMRKITKKEGLLGFYKGSTASLLRTGPHTVLSLMFWNEFRKLYDYYGSEVPEAEVAQL
ncbi:solute carrier family 25 member 35-like [Argiope bruennichi]|uniref:solute carrier family 25 member 35-like n=1 Tax=Argiope bruennichi TaxID=94029 RepID=UPI0024959085|nr:solute carrier family 25 member 35-like [Argiope bruennichi]